MGLDVYLGYSKDLDKSIALQASGEQISESIWDKYYKAHGGEYDNIPDAEKDKAREEVKAAYKKLGLDSDGGDPNEISIEEDSTIDPEHMFKIGYLRSSYNEGGINSVLQRAGVPGLYEIFGVEDKHDYRIKPDWQASLERCSDAINLYQSHLESPMAEYDAIRIVDLAQGTRGAEDSEEALKFLKEELARHKPTNDFDAYSNARGNWWMNGISVVGVVPNKGWGGGCYVLYKREANEPIEKNYYLNALKITREMIEYVLGQPDSENYFLRWSS